MSPQTVSRLTRELDEAVRQFHQAPLADEWAYYLFLDGVSLRLRRASGRQRVHLLGTTEGVRTAPGNGSAYAQPRREPDGWGGLLEDLYRRGLKGKHLMLNGTDGCPGLAAATETVYPRVLHRRCRVHKMRNILQKVRRRDHDTVKADAQAI